eukprot:215109_1
MVPSIPNNIFSVLISLCIIPFSCKCCIALYNEYIISAAFCSGKHLFSALTISSNKSLPWHSSNTIDTYLPSSNMSISLIMFLCDIFFRICISLRKPRSYLSDKYHLFITFTAND